MNRDPGLLIGEQTDVGHLLEEPGFVQFGRAAVVDHTGRPLGVLSVTDVQRRLRVSRLEQSNGGRTRVASH